MVSVALLRLPGRGLGSGSWAVPGRLQTARRKGGSAPAEVHRPGRQFIALESPAGGPRRTIRGSRLLRCRGVPRCVRSRVVRCCAAARHYSFTGRPTGTRESRGAGSSRVVSTVTALETTRRASFPPSKVAEDPDPGPVVGLRPQLGRASQKRLTTRCSGLASLAAELGIVRRASP